MDASRSQPSKEDQIADNIFQMIVSRGTISVGELLVGQWTPDEVSQALGILQNRGVVTQTGNYYSLSLQGARIANKWGKSLSV